jgi:membrane protein DedA with SNARE-associated domain
MLLWAGLFVMLGTIFGETALEMDILNGLPWVLAAAFSITVIGSIAYFIWRYLTRSRVMVADGE